MWQMAETKLSAIAGSNIITQDEVLQLDFIIEMILLRLPVKDLVRLTLVCKLWYSLITSPNFIDAHLKKNHTSPSNYCYFQFPTELKRLQQHSYKLIRNDLGLNLGTIPVVHSDLELSFVGNSCNGILCFTNTRLFAKTTNTRLFYGRMVFLFNPSIKKLKLIAHDSFMYKAYDCERVQTRLGFGYCESSRDFKVVRMHYIKDPFRIYPTYQPPQVEIYSLNADCWRRITVEFKVLVKDNQSVSKNGAIYWWAENDNSTIGNWYSSILTFNITTEEFHVIELPPALKRGFFACGPLLSYNGMLSVFCPGIETYADRFKHHELWVLEKCGNNRSWSRVFKSEATANELHWAIGFTSNGKLLISTYYTETVAYWNPKTDLLEYADCDSTSDYHMETAFVESLVLFGENDRNVSLGTCLTKATGAHLDVLPNGIDIHKLKTREDDDVIVWIATNDTAVNYGVEELKIACGSKKPAVVVVTGSVHTEEKWMIQLTTRNYTMIVDWCDGGVAPESLAKFLANPEICFVMNTSGSLFKVFPFPMFANGCRGSTTLEHLIDVVRKKNGSVPRVAYEENVAGRYAEGNLFERKGLSSIMSAEANKERICRRYAYYKICYRLFCYLLYGEPLSQD